MQFEVDVDWGRQPVPYLGMSREQLILVLYPVFLIPAIYLLLRDIRRRRLHATSPPGCMKVGLKGTSRMSDELDHQYAIPPSSKISGAKDFTCKIKGLFIYPIKSCHGIEMESAALDGTGFAWDRTFVFAELLTSQTRQDAAEFARKQKWTCRTLRQPGWNKLALVKPEIWIPDNTKTAPYQLTQTGGVMVVKFPFIPDGPIAFVDRWMVKLGFLPAERSFTVPLSPPPGSYPIETVALFTENLSCVNMGKHLPADFRHFIGVKNPISLFRIDPEMRREIHGNAPHREEVGYQPSVNLQDEYPQQLLNLASVHDVGSRVQDQIPKFSARRFRPNLVITGPPAYDEDDWKRIQIGQHEFYCACRTLRCRLPNVDPDTSERHPTEPDKTLKSYRCIDEGDPLNACMGLSLVSASSETFKIRVGDALKVLERGQHRVIK